MRKILVAIFSLVLIASANAEKGVDLASGKMTTVRMHTSVHGNANARELALVKISGLEDGCNSGVFLDARTDKDTLSLILAAYVSKSPVRIGYEPNSRAPWGDNAYCALTYFDIK